MADHRTIQQGSSRLVEGVRRGFPQLAAISGRPFRTETGRQNPGRVSQGPVRQSSIGVAEPSRPHKTTVGRDCSCPEDAKEIRRPGRWQDENSGSLEQRSRPKVRPTGGTDMPSLVIYKIVRWGWLPAGYARSRHTSDFCARGPRATGHGT